MRVLYDSINFKGVGAQLVILSLLPLAALQAQVNTASIVGTVTDLSDASVPGANVEVRNTGTGAVQTATTDERGNYIFDRLPVGQYVVSVGAEGFQPVERTGIKLDATQRAKVDFKLQVGPVSESITVEAGAPVVNTQSTELGIVVNETQVKNLPLNGRNFAQLISLETGTVRQGDGIYFNGLTRDGISVNIDGTDAANPDRPSTEDFGGQTQQNLVSVEFIQEFKTSTGVFSAETGRALSGAVNVITKSGGNEFHGAAYHFLRNDKLDARNFFARERDKLRLNQFGANVGGPILGNRLFFFVGWEGVRERRGRQVTGQVPSAILAQELRETNPALIPLLNILPEPTEPTADPLRGFHRRSDVNTNREDSGTARIDFLATSADNFFVRYSIIDAESAAAQLAPSNALQYPTQNRSGTASWTRVISPRLLNEFRAGVNKQDLPRTHGAFTPRGIPFIRGGVLNTGLIKFLRANGGSWTLADNVSYNSGRHSVRAGFEMRAFHNGRSEFQNPIYDVTSMADLRAGRFTKAIITVGSDTRRITETHLGFYVQDDLRVNRRLTLNMGLRYEYFSPQTERDGLIFNVTDGPFSPFRPQGEPILNPDKNNFAPRLGFAYDIGGDSKNVIRGGAGVYYSPISSRQLTSMVNPPDEPFKFDIFGRDGFTLPVDEAAIVSNLDQFPVPKGYIAYDPNARMSYSTQWMFNYQRTLAADFALDVGYVGNRGLKLKDLRFINDFDPFTGTVPNPEFGRIRWLENSGMSTYHSLQATLRKRLSHGLQFNGHYTYGKSITIGGVDNVSNSANNRVQNPNDRRGSRGRSDADITHVLTFDYTWDLPFAAWFGASGTNRVWNGWQVLGIISANTGSPIYVTSGRDSFGNGDAKPQRPDYVFGQEVFVDGYRDSASHQFLNPAAFAEPCAARGLKRPCGVFGNLGRNVFDGPGSWNVDFSLMKDTKLTERTAIQFRTEFFNLFNHANFGNPISSVANSRFGQITGASRAREIQFALKLIF